MEAAIATYGLSKEFPLGGGVHGLSFRVQPGEAVGLVGPSAAGKSTLLKLLATRIPATHGSFTVLGHRISSYRVPAGALAAARRNLGVLLEEAPVAGDLTGWENAWVLARLHGLTPREASRRLDLLFEWAGIGNLARRPTRTYSYPVRRKLGLIQALVHAPRVLLLDEPFHGLDLPARAALQGHLLQLRREGVAVLVATCDSAEAATLCDRALLLQGGRVVADGAPRTLMSALGSWSTIDVKVGGPLGELNLEAVPGRCARPEFSDGTIRVRVTDPDRALAPLMECLVAAGVMVLAVDVKRPRTGGRGL